MADRASAGRDLAIVDGKHHKRPLLANFGMFGMADEPDKPLSFPPTVTLYKIDLLCLGGSEMFGNGAASCVDRTASPWSCDPV
jgi:hypothetical protein